MVKQEEIKAAINKCNKMLDEGISNPADQKYIEHVRDALGWVLGEYDHPLQDY